MLTRLGFPDIGRHRRFVLSLGIDALGSGIWVPLTMLYFVRQTPLTLVDVGLVMTLAHVVVIPAVPLIGQLVDAFGPKRILQAGNVVQAASFALYPFADANLTVGICLAMSAVGRSMFWGANGPLVTQITQPGEREQWFGFVQAMRNAGMGVGGLLAGLALSIGTSAAYDAVVLANAASYVIAFLLMAGVVTGAATPRPAAGTVPVGGWGVVLHDRGYRWLVASTFLFALMAMVLTILMPVYFAELLGLPGWVPGAVFVVNTVMIGLGQGFVVRAMTGSLRHRAVLLAVGFTAGSFAMMYAADSLSVPFATTVVIAAAVVYTLGELVAGPVLSALSAEAAPDESRGRYMSVVQLAWNASGAVSPLFYAFLLDRGSLAAWGGPFLLCGVFAVCVLRMSRELPRARQPVTNVVEAAD